MKFTAYDFSIYGGLEATLEQIGADTITDERQCLLHRAGAHHPQHHRRRPHAHHPGMVAEVDILTGKKSLLSYLMKPVLRAKANALTERWTPFPDPP